MVTTAREILDFLLDIQHGKNNARCRKGSLKLLLVFFTAQHSSLRPPSDVSNVADIIVSTLASFFHAAAFYALFSNEEVNLF